ncbi:glycoside hydrolase family 18 protein [Chitinispirillales bacterium ANBcel5]|uniref:glycoside hydrolase family 18 protein n=1 Tax=Cellulosispirillum alkaliphilum TaxID=3039283 RepID=UPI002A53363B|nr:glycoside hydrolase family 18 protein [Chitinispirillales bacterium ANBcel5]
MLKFTLFFLLFIISLPCAKQIIGYYPGWRIYDRDALVNPLTIKYDKFTIINYAFLAPNEDGSITLHDPWADENILLGQRDPNTGNRDETTSLIYNAHKHGVQVLASVGGWTLSEHFSAIAKDPVKTAQFASDCIKLITTYGFDGIDIDWEYPGYEAHNGGPEDKENFTTFLQTIRDTLDSHGNYVLTACFSASPLHLRDVELQKVASILDYLNIMTYDYHGPWHNVTDHNSPLYASAESNQDNSFDASFRYLLEHGIDAQNITLGVAFYGRSFVDANHLRSNHSGEADVGNWPSNSGAPSYHSIMDKWDHLELTRFWDDDAKVPYAIYGNNFLTYDDEESIAHKAQYVVDNQAAGVIIWEITGDFFEDESTPLLDTLYSVLHGEPTGLNNRTKNNIHQGKTIQVTARSGYFLLSPAVTEKNYSISVFDLSGRSVAIDIQESADHLRVYLPKNSSSKLFLLRIKHNQGSYTTLLRHGR